MKKLTAFLLSLALCVLCAFCVAGCNDDDDYEVFVPDGAPALSIAGIEWTEADRYFDVNVVDASAIGSFVTGGMRADVAIMPVNAAVKQLGSGENYTLLGTVTHGNLYLLKKEGGEDISVAADLNKLVGKTVGIINLNNVPGLTFKVILNDNDLPFNVLTEGVAAAEDKVNLKDVNANAVLPTSADCDYFVVPEPAATTKVTKTQGKLSIAGDLQALYGEGGYPQAVAVAKKSIVKNDPAAIRAFIDCFSVSKNWIMAESTTPYMIYEEIDDMTEGDMAHAFTADNLTKQVIQNCGINYESNSTGKDKIISFMQKLNAVSGNAWGTPSNDFFYVAQ